MKKVILLPALILGLAACVSAPKGLEQDQFQIQDIKSIQKEDYECQCNKARLGGRVLNATALKDKTKIEILSYPILKFSAKPALNSEPDGRFIAYVDGFLDPEILKDQYMTFSGILVGTEKGKVDQATYQYPVLNAHHYKLWKLVDEYYYDPEDWDDYWEYRHHGGFGMGFGGWWRPQPKLRKNLY